jgi:acyl carrier protein
MSDTIAREVREFVVSNFLFGQPDPSLTDDQSLLEAGVIDSTGVLELVSFIEQRYGLAIGDRELLPENLDSIQNASSFIIRKLAAQANPIVG